MYQCNWITLQNRVIIYAYEDLAGFTFDNVAFQNLFAFFCNYIYKYIKCIAVKSTVYIKYNEYLNWSINNNNFI